MNQIDLYEDHHEQLHLHRQGDTLIYDLLQGTRLGGFQDDAIALSAGAFAPPQAHPYDEGERASWQHVATWYGPGVFMVYLDTRTIGRNAERYIGSYLIHAPEADIEDFR